MADPNTPDADVSSVGADLSAAWDEAASQDPAAEPASPSAAPEQPDESSPSSSGGDAGRPRDEQGRFTKAEQRAQEQAAQAAAQQAPTEFKVPDRWPADVRAELGAMHKVNPKHAEFVLKQYAFMRGEATRWAQSREKQYESLAQITKQVDDLLSPGRQGRALKGITDAQYVRHLVAAGDFLDRNPVEGIKFLAKQYGLDLANLQQAAGGEPEIPRALQQVIEEQQRIKQALQMQYVGMEEGRLREAGDWVNKFATEMDGQGQPLRPYFDEVLNEIIFAVQHQMQSGRQVDVDAAYKSAIRMNDSVWLKEQTRTSEASRREAAAKRAREIEDAKRAGYSVSGSGGASDVPADNLRDELSRQYDKFNS